MEWRNLTLFVVKDYGNIRVSKLVPEQGAWPPAAGEILIERDAFQVARTSIGEDEAASDTSSVGSCARILCSSCWSALLGSTPSVSTRADRVAR